MTYHVGCRDIVEDTRDARLVASGYGDVEHPTAQVERLLKGQITTVVPDTLLQDANVQKVPVSPEAGDAALEGGKPRAKVLLQR